MNHTMVCSIIGKRCSRKSICMCWQALIYNREEGETDWKLEDDDVRWDEKELEYVLVAICS